jgi:predicted negative regulator of RcsB-dependent stress response
MIFFPFIYNRQKEGTVGTTKLTRKEIMAEDPVHEAIVRFLDFFRTNSKKIGILAAAAVLVAAGIYGGLQYLDAREAQAQEQLGKGMDFFHGQVAADAPSDPYAKGPTPVFPSESAKYQAAAREFSAVASRFSYSKISIVARYYLGLSQLELGQKEEAVKNLGAVSNNSKNRPVGYLAKRALAAYNISSGNYQGAREFLEGMIKDPQCNLPKEDLAIQLSRALVGLGKRDEAVKILKDSGSQGPAFSALKQQLTAELDKLQKAPATGSSPAQP